jgi:hypothetical protein
MECNTHVIHTLARNTISCCLRGIRNPGWAAQVVKRANIEHFDDATGAGKTIGRLDVQEGPRRSRRLGFELISSVVQSEKRECKTENGPGE